MKRYKLLRQELKERGIRQEAIAKAINLSRPMVSKKLCGLIPWTIWEAYQVLALLNYGPQMMPVLFPEWEVAA